MQHESNSHWKKTSQIYQSMCFTSSEHSNCNGSRNYLLRTRISCELQAVFVGCCCFLFNSVPLQLKSPFCASSLRTQVSLETNEKINKLIHTYTITSNSKHYGDVIEIIVLCPGDREGSHQGKRKCITTTTLIHSL